MEFSFIHAADIHLDSPLKGLEKYESAPVEKIRNATREAFVNLIDLAIEKQVAFVIIAGDLYDGNWRDYNTGLFFGSQMARLKEKDIKVFIIRGNHDAASIITKELVLPDNVKVFSTLKPESFSLEDYQVIIHGQGFNSRAVTENLAKNYPIGLENYFNIGVLHTSITGREGHENYSPCSLNELKGKKYDYWALGHIHLREVLNEESPVIIFPGNIQGRHIREIGQKGCTIVKVKDGVVEGNSHYPLDVLRWNICHVDATGHETIEQIIDQSRKELEAVYNQSEGKYLAVRFIFSGSTNVHQELLGNKDRFIANIRSLGYEVGNDDIWVEKVKLNTTRKVDLEDLKKQHSPIAGILDYIEEIENDNDVLQSLLEEFTDIGTSLPIDLNEEGNFNFQEIDLIKRSLDDVKDLIVTHLTKTEVNH
jgi:DNA repair protein SbcD/Mre11